MSFCNRRYHGLVVVFIVLMAITWITFSGCEMVEHQAKRPNILMAVMDDATYSHMSAYGCEWVKTPAFDYVAENGILFTNAYTPNAKCAPSRASVLTGRNPWQLEEAANHWCYFPQKYKTYAEVLAENGYHVGYTGKGWAPGVPGEIEGIERQLTGKAYSGKKTDPPTQYISDNDYSANFADFLDVGDSDQPFCFWYGSLEPHRGYEYRSGIDLGGNDIADIDSVYSFWPDNETVRTDLLDYAFEIEYFDKHLDKMIQILRDRGQLDNTLIIVTADNGMPFPRIKGQAYEFSNHMPLAVMWPAGIEKPGRRVDDFVSFIDFAPTFLQLADIPEEDSGMQPVQGKSLSNLLKSGKEGEFDLTRNHVLIGKERHDVGRPGDQGFPIRGIIRRDHLYIENFEPARWPAGNPETGYLNCDGSPTKTECLKTRNASQASQYWEWSFGKRPGRELYNIRKDRECKNNLADNPRMVHQIDFLRKQLYDELNRQEDPRILGEGHIFDDYPYADSDRRNFYERYMQGEKLEAGWVNPGDFEK